MAGERNNLDSCRCRFIGPKEKLISICRGEGCGAGKGGPLWSPAVTRLETLNPHAALPSLMFNKGIRV